MTNTYFYKIIDTADNSFAEFIATPETVLDKFAEALYIWQELTPQRTGWKEEMADYESTTFTYHGLELVDIEWKGEYFEPFYLYTDDR